jgi:predicted glutamine amidotransferase
MCGITLLYAPNGVNNVKPIFDLWTHQEKRGRDASGIFAITNKGLLYAKAPVPASEFVPLIADYVQRHGLVLYYALMHARSATRGTPLSNKNNHPIVRRTDDTIYAIVHNGTVDGVSACTEKLTATDTEELLCAYMSGGVDKLKEVLKYKNTALGIIAVGKDGNLIDFVVARVGNKPLVRAEFGDAVVYASEVPKELSDKFSIVKPSIAILTKQYSDSIPSYSYYICHSCKKEVALKFNFETTSLGTQYVAEYKGARISRDYYYSTLYASTLGGAYYKCYGPDEACMEFAREFECTCV